MAKQQGLNTSAQKLNLRAIQNLNSYVDGIITMQGGNSNINVSATPTSTISKYPFDRNVSLMSIEFVLALDEQPSMNKKASGDSKITTSRRMVELQLPPPHATTVDVQSLAARQLSKLLHIAGLPASKTLIQLKNQSLMQDHQRDGYYFDDENDDFFGENVGLTREEQEQRRRHGGGRRRYKTVWEQSRDAFTANIDWKKFDQLYEEAHRDMEADYMTAGLIRDNPKRRRELLATILQRVQVIADTDAVSTLDKLVTLRRLYHILDDNFDLLQLEECGRFWETVNIILQGPRPYNSSSTALHKRASQKLDTGFGYTIHHDNTMTIRIPIDFKDQELINELDRNVWDFYNLMQKDFAGVESIFR